MPFNNTIDFKTPSDIQFERTDDKITLNVKNPAGMLKHLCDINTEYPLTIYVEKIGAIYKIHAKEITSKADYDDITNPAHIVFHHHQTDTTMRLGFYEGNGTHKYKIIGTEDDRPTCNAMGKKNRYAYSISGNLSFRAKIVIKSAANRLAIKYPTPVTIEQNPQYADQLYCFECV
jgi:hypothetical protein